MGGRSRAKACDVACAQWNFRPTLPKTRKRVSRERGALIFLLTFLIKQKSKSPVGEKGPVTVGQENIYLNYMIECRHKLPAFFIRYPECTISVTIWARRVLSHAYAWRVCLSFGFQNVKPEAMTLLDQYRHDSPDGLPVTHYEYALDMDVVRGGRLSSAAAGIAMIERCLSDIVHRPVEFYLLQACRFFSVAGMLCAGELTMDISVSESEPGDYGVQVEITDCDRVLVELCGRLAPAPAEREVC